MTAKTLLPRLWQATKDVATICPGGPWPPLDFGEIFFFISIGIFNVNIQLAQKNLISKLCYDQSFHNIPYIYVVCYFI